LHDAALHDILPVVVAPQLIDRERELQALEDAASSPRGQLVVVWGRRRVGKTFLLQAFGERRRTIHYTATQQSAPIELAAFTDAVRAGLGSDGLPAGYAFPDWSAALEFVTDRAGDRRLVVVLDEFPYLAGSTAGIESIVQRWWDRQGRSSRVMLVLCGSAVAYMGQIGGAAAPLHQRATATIRVAALDYRAAGQFVAALAPAERAVVYGILGGTPLYLDQWDAHASRRANLLRLFGSPASPLVDAAELVLSGELPELENAFRILQAVAIGKTRQSEIADYARVAVERPLRRLAMLGLLERRVPALDDPARSKRAIYRVADPYFAFWFRFIAGNRAHIARGLGAQLVDNRILPELDGYMGGVFEDIAREHARHLAATGELEADRVEAWWSADGQHEIDLVGVSGGGIGFIGEAKWSGRPLSAAVLGRLEEHATALPGVGPTTPRLLYGRAGCNQTVAARPGIRCLSVAEVYGD
jgi:AAA+ ATPase superfamily predicted ATPase